MEAWNGARNPERTKWPDKSTVKVASCDQQNSILRRPIQLLYPHEIHSKFTDTSPSEAILDSETPEYTLEEVGADTQVRLKRAAARRANELMGRVDSRTGRRRLNWNW